jgi:hypothetical protein
MNSQQVRSGHGILQVAFEALGSGILRLPFGCRITAALQTPNSDAVDLTIEGPGLHPLGESGAPPRLKLHWTEETRVTGEGHTEHRIWGTWEHAPAERWLIRDWARAA